MNTPDSLLHILSGILFCDTISSDKRLTHPESQLSEVFCWDADRMAHIRDLLDSFIFISCVIFTMKQVLIQLNIPPNILNDLNGVQEMETFIQRLQVLLHQHG